MKICFVMYPWKQVEPESDSTLRLIHEAASRGHTVAVATCSKLTMRDSEAIVFANILQKSNTAKNLKTFYKASTFKTAALPLAGFDVIFMRDNPPLDLMALNFLDSVRGDTFICNDLDGLRLANNKLYTASLHDPTTNYIPSTHVSKNTDYLMRVIQESKQERMILKPLDGYGGSGVITVEKSAKSSVKSLLQYYIGEDKNYVILQEYVEGAEKGDVRILMLNGEPIGAMKRIPGKDDVRSNVHAGGTVEKHTLTKQEKLLCKHIGPKLVRDGLYFVGLDIINGKLLEVNVQSPGGITRINRLNRTNIQRHVIDFAESVVNAKELVVSRKNQFRKVIEDADLIQ